MAEGRMLKRRITLSKKMAALKTDKARLLWFYMLPFTDVDGRIIADCEDVRDEIIRKQRTGYSLTKIEDCLQDLYRVGLIILYESDGARYLEYTRFWEEQSHNRDRESKSTIPPPAQGTLWENSGELRRTPLKFKLSKDKLSLNKTVVFPEKLNTPEFTTTWQQWVKYRTERRRPLTPLTIDRQLKKLAEYSVVEAIAAIEKSIESGWQGLFPENQQAASQPKKLRLLPIPGKICSRDGCKLPAVYKDCSGTYDHFYCTKHMPKEVKERYE